MLARTRTIQPNAATALQMYRNETASMQFYTQTELRTCPCCKKRRSYTQFAGNARICANCRRPR